MVLSITAFSIVCRALEEKRIVLISLEREPGSSGRFQGQDFQRITSVNQY